MGVAIRQFWQLVRKEFALEFRNRVSLGAVLLFVVCAAYICYKVFITINGLAWISLFWIILLFAAINLIQRTFNASYMKRRWNYYTLYDSTVVYLSKYAYNLFFMGLVSVLLMGVMSLFFGNMIKDYPMFLIGLSLGILGMTGVMTFISAVVMRADSNGLLMSILAMPLCLPVLLLSMKVHAVSLRLIQDTAVTGDYLLLGGVDLLIFGIGLLLFPNLWKA